MERQGVVGRLSNELGFTTVLHAGRDVHLLLATRFLRMLAFGGSTLILALFFAQLGYSDTKIGLFMTLTLVGDVPISLAMTFLADAIGRRAVLVLGSLFMGGSGTIFAMFANYWILLVAATLGVISPSGNEIGPFRAIEEATLAQLTEASTRTDIFAWYVVIGTLGAATGSLGCGWLVQSLQSAGWRAITSYKFIFWIYCVIGAIKAVVSFFLSKRCELQPAPKDRAQSRGQREDETDEDQPFLPNEGSTAQPQPATPVEKPKKKKSPFSQISRKSRITLAKICGLFFFDSLASGMVPNSLIALFMERKFDMPEGQLGTIMSVAQFMSSIGNVFASAVAKRIGLVRAMVYTHLPSAILLALVPAPPYLILTVLILVLRASLASMDQAPRSAFLSAVVLPQERTATMGIVNTVKTMSQSSGPLITGTLAGEGRFWIAFLLAGGLKAGYDVGMLGMFLTLKLEGDKNPRINSADSDDHSDDRRSSQERNFVPAGSEGEESELELDEMESKKSPGAAGNGDFSPRAENQHNQ